MTVETLQVAFGATMDGLAILAACVYMPVANFVIRLREMDKELDDMKMYWWEKDDEGYECEM